MVRIPVYKDCDRCKGTGMVEYEVPELLNNHTYGNDTGTLTKACPSCNGTGKEKTSMWIEDPYSLFDLTEETV